MSLNQRSRGGNKKSSNCRASRTPLPTPTHVPSGFRLKSLPSEKPLTTSQYTVPSVFAPARAPSISPPPPAAAQKSSLASPSSACKTSPSSPSPTPAVAVPAAKQGKGHRRRSYEKEDEKKPKEKHRKSTCQKKNTVSTTLNRTPTQTPTCRTPTGTKTEDTVTYTPLKASKSKSKSKKRSGSLESKHSSEHKSSSSKDSEEEKRNKKEKSAALSFYKDLQSRRQESIRRNPVNSVRLEMMPESSQLSKSVKAMRTKLTKSMKLSCEVPEKETQPTDLFKPNGDPFWMNALPPAEDDELHTLLATADMKIEEKTWADVVAEFLDGKLPSGTIMDSNEQSELDPFADMEELKQNDECLSIETVNYLTAKTIHETCYEAVNRFRQNRDAEEMQKTTRLPSKEVTAKSSVEKVVEPTMKTCYGGDTIFDLKRNVFYSYDRRCPIASAQALTRKRHQSRSNKFSKEKTSDDGN